MRSALFRKATVLCLMTFFLVACGGSGDGKFTADSPGDEAEPEEERALALGVGQGDNFVEGSIGATTDRLSTDGTTQLTVNVIDHNQNNGFMTGAPVELLISSRCLSAPVPAASVDVPLT